MTGYFVKAAALALAVAVLAGLLKGRQASLAAALTLGGCAALFYFAALLLQPVRSFCSELAQTAGVAEAYLRPVLKCTGIALLTELCAALCRDGSFLRLLPERQMVALDGVELEYIPFTRTTVLLTK